MAVDVREPQLPVHITQEPRFKVVSHSNLFYWWPVWLVGFIMAALSYLGGTRLAIIPEGSTLKTLGRQDGGETFELTVPGEPGESLQQAADAPAGQNPVPFRQIADVMKTRPVVAEQP
jgi:hypothetical protein